MPASTAFTVDQALASAMSAGLDEVLIIGHDGDGAFFVRSSRMTTKDAFYLAEKLRNYALSGGETI